MQHIDLKISNQASKVSDWISCSFNSVPCPCDSCEFETRCKNENLACKDFLNYVEKADTVWGDRIPTRRLFIKAFLCRNEASLDESEILEIRQLNKQRGVTHRMIADLFYILPETVRKIVGAL